MELETIVKQYLTVGLRKAAMLILQQVRTGSCPQKSCYGEWRRVGAHGRIPPNTSGSRDLDENTIDRALHPNDRQSTITIIESIIEIEHRANSL